jgi:hypothetical protein
MPRRGRPAPAPPPREDAGDAGQVMLAASRDAVATSRAHRRCPSSRRRDCAAANAHALAIPSVRGGLSLLRMPRRQLGVVLLALLIRGSAGTEVRQLPKGCTFIKHAEGPDKSSCFSDHWCHAMHNWCKAHAGERTLPHGAPGCSDPASGGEEGSMCDRSKITGEYCARVCYSWRGYTKSGTTGEDKPGGNSCYCGDKLNKAGSVQPPASCSQPCAGDPTEMCGAPAPSWSISVGELIPEGCEGFDGARVEREIPEIIDYLSCALIMYCIGAAAVRACRLCG